VPILAHHGDRRLVGAGHHRACQLGDAFQHLLGRGAAWRLRAASASRRAGASRRTCVPVSCTEGCPHSRRPSSPPVLTAHLTRSETPR
jgi:hypothetical protein